MILMNISGPTRTYKVREYIRSDGSSPYQEWLKTLPVRIRARIEARVTRFELGNLGDCMSLGRGVFEARFHFGPGYRLYFGVRGRTVVILLCGGDKSTQSKDIYRAQEYWQEYLEGSVA
jgi:putative addiction module killer protein